MITWGYNILDYTIPKGLDRVKFAAKVAKAMRYIEKCSKGRVRFLHRGLVMEGGEVKPVKCKGFVNIGFENLPDSSGAGEWSRREAKSGMVDSIAFASNANWARGWWDKVLSFKPDLYTVAVHELGHLVGLEHNLDPNNESVMSLGARFNTFAPHEIEQLRRLSLSTLAALMLAGCTGVTYEPCLSFSRADGKTVKACLKMEKEGKP